MISGVSYDEGGRTKEGRNTRTQGIYISDGDCLQKQTVPISSYNTCRKNVFFLVFSASLSKRSNLNLHLNIKCLHLAELNFLFENGCVLHTLTPVFSFVSVRISAFLIARFLIWRPVLYTTKQRTASDGCLCRA